MSESLTPEQVDVIAARAEKVPAEPMESFDNDILTFVAYSRQDIPRLIMAIREARAERDSALTKLKQYEERDRIEANRHRLSPPSHLEDIADATIRAERDQFRAEAVELRDALEQFDEFANYYRPSRGDDSITYMRTQIGKIRHAQAILTSTTLTAKHIERDRKMERFIHAEVTWQSHKDDPEKTKDENYAIWAAKHLEYYQSRREALAALKAVQDGS